jgi:hypothetical protein
MTDTNLSSIDQSYLLKPMEGGSSNMFRSYNDNKENQIDYSNIHLLNPHDKSCTFDSNQSMEI